MSNTIRLGQKWRTRRGHVVTIRDYLPGQTYCWVVFSDGTNRVCVNDNGHEASHVEGLNDLVELVDDSPVLAIGLGLGQKWRTRGGKTVTIARHLANSVYCWLTKDEEGNTEQVDDLGRNLHKTDTEHDLVELLESTAKIALGQKWVLVSGDVGEIVGYTPALDYPWEVKIGDRVVRVDVLGESVVTGCNLSTLLADAPAVQFAGDEPADADALASETLQALGWKFDGQAWVQDQVSTQGEKITHAARVILNSSFGKLGSLYDERTRHPLYPVYMAAIEQAMYGKGERHGGNATPFLDQPWVHYVKMHGRGFATGQAAKKLEEAASQREGEAFETEMLGAIVYAGMSVLKERGVV